MELCSKRNGSKSAPVKLTFHVHHQESMVKNKLDKSNKNSEIGLAEKRAELDKKLKATFESIFEKYSKDFNGIGDEIDIATGEIVIDNGHLLRMQSQGKEDVWNYTRNQKTRINDEALENSAFSPKISSIICEEENEEQDLRGNPVINEEDASESECDCDCYEDDLILRGFVRANRFLRLPSKDISSIRLDTFQRDSTLASLSSYAENKSEVNETTNKRFFQTKPKISKQAYDHTVHDDEIELAWRLPKLPPSPQDINRKTIERTDTEKLFTLHANLSFNSKSVEYWGLERQARQFKLECHNYSYFSNYSPEYANEKIETNVSSCVKATSQDLSICNWKGQLFRGEENPPNLAAKEMFPSGTDSKDSKEPIAKHRNIACEQEEIIQNAEFKNITKNEVSQIPNVSIHNQKISGSNSDSLLKNNDLIFDDVGHSSSPPKILASVSNDTFELNVPLDGSNTHKIHENGILSSSSIDKKYRHMKLVETVKKSESLSSNILNNKAIATEESSRSPSKKSLTSTEKYEAKNSRSPIHNKKNFSDKSFEKPIMVPKQKLNYPSNSLEIYRTKIENFSVLKPILNKKTNIIPLAQLHIKKPTLISTPIKVNTSQNSSTSKHRNLVPITPNRNLNLEAETTILNHSGKKICEIRSNGLRSQMNSTSLA
ncbi:hypothetical protein EPUL_002811 [Erysiphe pulchra]|uniref:Uncharacterized protein n=1 Tax=Erysiphe pulchra TaxID=225359 RepID=A0A2S4PTM1_9PEZI|nr:hypothetical protein EPUL_002811 [Erysiphe pulchra]